MLKRFLNDVKKYAPYAIKAGKAELKSDVASSHLSWMWWILDPLLFMCVYTFVSLIVFGKAEQYFSAFIFIGYTSFKFFDKTLKSSVKLVAANKSVVKNVYIPKYILLLKKLYVNTFTSGISFMLVFITMAYYRVPLTIKCLYFIPLFILLTLLSVGLGSILMHFGVYVEDLANVLNITLRLFFYLSGVFYSVENRIDDEMLRFIFLKVNPISFIIVQMRNVLLYDREFDFITYFIWLFISIVIVCIGVNVIYKNENGYVKVI